MERGEFMKESNNDACLTECAPCGSQGDTYILSLFMIGSVSDIAQMLQS